MTWIIFQNEKYDDIKTTIIIENFMVWTIIMLAEINMRSLTYPVSQLLDVSKNVRAEVDNEETKTCRKKR